MVCGHAAQPLRPRQIHVHRRPPAGSDDGVAPGLQKQSSRARISQLGCLLSCTSPQVTAKLLHPQTLPPDRGARALSRGGQHCGPGLTLPQPPEFSLERSSRGGQRCGPGLTGGCRSPYDESGSDQLNSLFAATSQPLVIDGAPLPSFFCGTYSSFERAKFKVMVSTIRSCSLAPPVS